MSRGGRILALIASVIALAILHYTLRPVLAWRANIDFLLIAVLLVAVRVRPGGAALVGLAAGLVADALAPSAFGAAAIAYVIVAAGASRLKTAFFSDQVLLNAAFIFGGKLAFDVAYVVLERRLGGGALWAQLGVWSPLSALLTAVTGVVIFAIVRPFVDEHRRLS